MCDCTTHVRCELTAPCEPTRVHTHIACFCALRGLPARVGPTYTRPLAHTQCACPSHSAHTHALLPCCARRPLATPALTLRGCISSFLCTQETHARISVASYARVPRSPSLCPSHTCATVRPICDPHSRCDLTSPCEPTRVRTHTAASVHSEDSTQHASAPHIRVCSLTRNARAPRTVRTYTFSALTHARRAASSRVVP